MIRAQSLLVILIVLLVIGRGVVKVGPDPHTSATPAAERTLSLASLDQSSPSATGIPSPMVAATPTVAPTATPMPSPVPSPTLQPTATPSPTPTVEPTPTERPVPPDTGMDSSVVVYRGDSGRIEVAFTFDAGAGRGHTEQILDLLQEHGASATFGITGLWAQQNPDLVQRMINEGHQIINHTWDHASFTGVVTNTEPLGPDERQAEVEAAEAEIVGQTDGYTTKPYFRFPYEDYDLAGLELLGKLGYSYTISWSCDTLAWQGDPLERIMSRCGVESDAGGPGAILLLHVAEDGDLAALGPLLDDYQQAGYDFVTIEQLLQP